MFLFAKLVMENLSNQTSQYDLIKELDPPIFPIDLKQAYVSFFYPLHSQHLVRLGATLLTSAGQPLEWGR